MAMPKKYFQDHLILLLLSTNAFLAFSTVVLVLTRLSAGHGNSYIVQYRSSLGINAFKTGGVSDLLGFILFAFLVLAIHTSLSLRTYPVNRHLSIVILAIGILLLLLTAIISNALLVLH
ncbi:MAG: hypothetical protein JWN82_291 [Candidatus Saccharibacteria bacterium]|nr:hypothetical protein [Candidatus Saccharibacteria bacterium]